MPTTLDNLVGPLAGVATAGLWTITSLVFTAAARRLGSVTVNTARITIAIVLLAVTHHLVVGAWWPVAQPKQIWLLGASGVLGLALGDQALFVAFVTIGPRLALLVMTTAPLMAALFGYVALDERISALGALGIALTVGGIAWVVAERPAQRLRSAARDGAAPRPAAHPHYVLGVVLALVGALCQAGGSLLSKQGMGHGWLPRAEHMGPQAATLVRMVFAGVGMVPIIAWYAWRRHGHRIQGQPAPRRVGTRSAGWLLTLCGGVVGPYLGVWMSLVAFDRAPLGVAQTLLSLVPVFILPFSRLVHDEHISPRAVAGAVVAVGGSALLFLA